MSKKKLKSTDSKKTVQAETTDYQLITLEENHVFQIKHENLIQRIWNSIVLLVDVEQEVKENKKNENLIKEWQNYLSCDKIPKPFEPQNIRDFFYKSLHLEKEDIENTINWMLAIDECSILNQDIDSQNMTKMVLKNSRIDFGEQYDVRICDTLELLRRIEHFLKLANKEVSREVLHDIEELQQFAQNKICYYVDNLTYRVLSSEAAYMESIDATTAEYSFKGQHFDIHLWTFQNVPLNLDPEETKSKSLELRQIKTNLEVPFSVLSENMVIRGLHYHFDHLSQKTRYNELPISMNDGIEKNVKLCLQKEWASQLKIQADIKAKMIKERADFEEAMRLKAEEEELKAKEAKNDEKPKKVQPKRKDNSVNLKKLAKEPPIVTPDLVPLVRRDFLEQDSQDYSNAVNKCHPNKLTLSKGEVNLREYQILGGIYQINSLSKPTTTSFPKLIMTWYDADKNIEYKSTEIDAHVFQSDDISKFFELTFELPDCFCHWSEPVACLFEEHNQISHDVDSLETTKPLRITSPIIINDFNLNELFTEPMMYDFLEICIPRVISSFKFPEDFHDKDADKKSKTTIGRPKSIEEDEEANNDLQMQRKLLSFDQQNSPERLFPLFKNVLPVVILPSNEDKEKLGMQPYEYFSELLSTLESIKDSYRKSTFKDRLGNPVKVLAEEYERNIRRPRVTTKLVAYGETEKRKSSLRTSLHKSGRDSLGSQKESLKTGHLSLKAHNDKHNLKDDKCSSQSKTSLDDSGKDEEEFSKWSTANVLKSVFNANEKKITIWTDRLGTFGFAFNRYQHFPLKTWSLQPSEENSSELELKIESPLALFRIYISGNGFRAFVTDFSTIIKKRKIYLEMKEPVSEISLLKEKLQEKFLNIFPDADAVWYVNGDFSQKHLAAELHTYDCISLNAMKLKFHSSIWNKLSNRRTMVLAIGELKQLEQDLCLIKITPEDVMFVEIRESINALGIKELEYVTTWRNLEWYADLNQLIRSSFVDVDTNDSKLKNQNIIIFYLRNLLHSLRLLSFS